MTTPNSTAFRSGFNRRLTGRRGLIRLGGVGSGVDAGWPSRFIPRNGERFESTGRFEQLFTVDVRSEPRSRGRRGQVLGDEPRVAELLAEPRRSRVAERVRGDVLLEPVARRLDAMMQLRKIPGLDGIANRLATPKVRLARRAAKRANPSIQFAGIAKNVIEPDAAMALIDSDFMFLGADSHQARMLFNAIVHQFLIPGIQIGTRIDVDSTGEVGDIRSNVRLVHPYSGCLRCNGLISGARLQEESMGPDERERNRYVDEVPAPSAINFNTLTAGQVVSDFMLMVGDLIDAGAPLDYLRFLPRERKGEPVRPVRNKLGCPDCGLVPRSRRARGDSVELPLPQRSQ